MKHFDFAIFVITYTVAIFATYMSGYEYGYKDGQKNTNETHILDDIRDCNHCPCMDDLLSGIAMEVT